MSNTPSNHFMLVLRETAGETEGADEGKFASLMERGYSGRGMYGRQCPAISGSWAACQQFIALAINGEIEQVIQDAADADGVEDSQRFRELEGKTNDFVRKVLDFSTDQLGYDIVLYWPQQEFTSDEES